MEGDDPTTARFSSSPSPSSMDDRNYITQEELKTHNHPGDLWISIQGKVYNVTDWINHHPGGDRPILHLAGQDATDAFIAYHPATAWKHLDSLFTGYYVKDFQISDISADYRRLHYLFSRSGIYEKKGHVTLFTLASVIAMFAAVVYLVVFRDGVWTHLLAGMLLGMLWIQAAYIGHDSGHYQVMKTRGYNKLAQLLSGNCLTGISIAWWKWTHNAHHLACNSLDYDPDLQHIPVLAVSSKFFTSITSYFYDRELTFDPLARFLISYQHWTYYPIMCVARVNLYVQTILLLFSTRKVPDRSLNILGIAVFWIWFPLLVACLPNWGERVMFVMASFVVTALQHIQFTLNHFSADVYVGPPTGNDWFEKQAAGTIDIDCSSWMDWFFGGLQFQLEHHLFPRLPRTQLRKVAPLVKDLCKKHGLPYRSFTFWQANRRTIATLRSAAIKAQENLVWEAVNTYG